VDDVRAVLQRVSEASVTVGGTEVSSIDTGILVLVAVSPDDTEADAEALASKIVNLRIFSDDQGKMNLALGDVGGEVLVVSQFTLLADVRRGRRPSFVGAATPDVAEPLVGTLADCIAGHGIVVRSGSFGASMAVRLVNDGPVTLVVETTDGAVN
jgi:D-tyrosyl-tRNA(Tyr) deacylase